ncbi:MAG: DUF4340 domain-containing protein [Opitutaceae bacterium]
MNKNYLLGGLLAIQAVAGYVILTGGGDLQKHSGIQKLVEIDRDALDGIRIEDSEGNVAELKIVDDSWVTADDFPADSDRVDRLLDRLVELEHGLAIASSSSSAKRFEVSEDAFQRRVELLDGDKTLGSIYLGTGAGARRSHVRLADESSIYTATIGTFELPAEISEWQDKTVLNLDFDSVHSVEFEGLKLSRVQSEEDESESDEEANSDASEWAVESLADEEIFDYDGFESALRSLTSLRINEVSSSSLEGLDLKGELTVGYADTSRIYKFYKSEENDAYTLSVSDYEELFEIASFTGDRIVENLSKQELVSFPEPIEVEELAEEPSDSTAETEVGSKTESVGEEQVASKPEETLEAVSENEYLEVEAISSEPSE